ncbi:MAG: FtsX-like permease family protein [Candidatus Aminicenantes bacterium]|nr:FtsX-like permease family protein [Candidatus Aminicenantes bacterium]NIM77815.1 FtsX-like permease family protein [Candidatus Aminicenantes bacterium]NIN17128.1 FtsX-like permease family protein [Candidatus Aminicenantes bacterium]NIN41021.1 FtsX-like permease family protein [Candidatus Aminicenantes bacterium]NIN83826.1 FtsX-like permease family protein [Candidatus Aminicenantes bacterium]
MFKNYFKVAFRSLLRHKGHSFINITCLSIGIAACLLILLWVQDELSYDRYHENADRIYRVVYQLEVDGQIRQRPKTPLPLAPTLVNEFPWIQKAVRLGKANFLIKCKDKPFREEILFTDPNIFEVFTFHLVIGNPDTALNDPRSILISEDMRKKYFGEENPIGQIITLEKNHNYIITGVFNNIPRNSHFKFNFISSIFGYRKDYFNEWGVSNFWTYLLVADDSPLSIFEEKMPQFVEKYRGKELRDMYRMTYLLQPLTKIHLYSHLRGEIEENGDIVTVYILSAVALFILLIACLNYINLATARFTNRAKEAGLRRVLGAAPAQLIKQFLGESFLSALVALPLAILLAELFLPLFNSLSGKPLAFHYFNNLFILAGMVGIISVVGLLSGILPALFIMAFHPTDALRGIIKTGPVITLLRRSLVVFQFSISIIFIICMMIVSHQLHYTKTRKLGLNKENIVNIAVNHNEEARRIYETIKHEFLQHPNIIAVSASGFTPGRAPWNNNYWYKGISPTEYRMIGCLPVDYDFIETLDINVVEGRGFSRNFPSDEKSTFMINKAALKEFGWETAVGKYLNVSNDWKQGTIVGVVDDFHFNSLHNKVEPLVLYIDPPGYDFFSVRITPGDIQGILNFLENKWHELVPGESFLYSFLEDDYDRLYKTEFRLKKILTVVTLLELFIACLGLLGLAAFSVEKRVKEIGIRKVFGASVQRIVFLLSKEFTVWVLVSNIIAWPIAWYAMKQWLQNFAYRIDILPWTFLLAGLITLIIALLTIIYKTVRAAAANPVETLRYE